LTLATISACESELERLKLQKKASLRDFVMAAKTKLVQLWDETFVPQEERVLFRPAFTDGFTDESLDSFDMEIKKIEARAEKVRPIIDLIKQRDHVLSVKNEYSTLLLDPNRFKIPGRLLQEEKLRKTFTAQLPRLTSSLKNLIAVWEKENGVLMIDGVNYLQSIIQQEMNDNNNNSKSIKKNKKTHCFSIKGKTSNSR